VLPLGQFDIFRPWATNRAPEPCTLLLYGRLREYKGIRVVLDAMPQIVAQHPDVKLIIAGQGNLQPFASRISAYAANIEVINRFLTEAESTVLFERSSILLAPYLEASQSTIPSIAASFARPIIASRIGGIPEIVHDDTTGLLIPPQDTHALAAAVNRLLDDAEQQERLGRNAKRFMQNAFGYEVIGGALDRIYRQAVRSA